MDKLKGSGKEVIKNTPTPVIDKTQENKGGLDAVKGSTRDLYFDETPIKGITTNINRNDYKDLVPHLRIEEGTEALNRQRAERQSWGSQFLGFLNQSVLGEIVGGGLQGIGAIMELPSAIYNEITGGQQDWDNFMMSFGNDITEWTKDATPIHRLNPNKTFDWSDTGWWFSNGVSIASTVGMLVPAYAGVKGASWLGKGMGRLADLTNVTGKADKIARAEKLLKTATNPTQIKKLQEIIAANKFGSNADKFLNISNRMTAGKKALAKTAVGAITMRNAENMRESLQTLNDVKDSTLQKFIDSDEEYQKTLQSEVGKEFVMFANENGVDINKDAFAQYIGAKASKTTYAVNSINIVFDFLQLGSIIKPTAFSRSGGNISREVLEKIAPTSNRLVKAYRKASPYAFAVGRQGTEGVEEAINYIGGEEGKEAANKMLGTSTNATLGERLGKYLKDEHLWESAFWGVGGGVAFEGVSSLINKGEKAVAQQQLASITKRESMLKEHTIRVKEIQNAVKEGKLTKEAGERYIAQNKAALSMSLGLNAAANRSVDILLEQINNGQFKQSMISNMTEEERKELGDANIDAAIEKTKQDIVLTEQIYNEAYNHISTKNISEQAKSQAIAEYVSYSFQNEKNNQQAEKVKNQIYSLEKVDNTIKNSKNPFIKETIQVNALEAYVNELEIQNALPEMFGFNKAENNVKIKEAKAKIKELTDIITTNGQTVSKVTGINENLETLYKEMFNYEFVNTYNDSKIGELQTNKGLKHLENSVNKANEIVENRAKTAKFDAYKENINKVVLSYGNDYKAIIAELEKESKLQNEPEYKKYVDSKLKEYKAKQEFINKTQEATIEPTTPTETKPEPKVNEVKPGEEKPIESTSDITDKSPTKSLDELQSQMEKEFGNKKAVDNLIAKIESIIDDENKTVQAKLKDLETRYNANAFKDKAAVKEFIRSAYQGLASNSKKEISKEREGIKAGEVYEHQGNKYEIVEIYTNFNDDVFIEMKKDGKIIKASFNNFNEKVLSGDIKLQIVEEKLSSKLTDKERTDKLVQIFNETGYGTLFTVSEFYNLMGEDYNNFYINEVFSNLIKLGDTLGINIMLSDRMTSTTVLGKTTTGLAQYSKVFQKILIDPFTLQQYGVTGDKYYEIINHELIHAILDKYLPSYIEGGINTEREKFDNSLRELIEFINYETPSAKINAIVDIINASTPEELITYSLTNIENFRAFIENAKTHERFENLPAGTFLSKFKDLLNSNESLKPLVSILEKTINLSEKVPTELNIVITREAKKLAESYNIDYNQIVGTGRNGTVTKKDVEEYLRRNKLQQVKATEEVTIEVNNRPVENSYNFYIPFLDLGVQEDGTVSAKDFNEKVNNMFGIDSNLTQEDLVESIKAVLDYKLNNGSKVEFKLGSNNVISILNEKGVLIGYVNNLERLSSRLAFVNRIESLDLQANLELLKGMRDGADKRLLEWKIREQKGNNTDKPFSTYIAIAQEQYNQVASLHKQMSNALFDNPNARVFSNVTRKTSGNLINTNQPQNITEVFPNANELWYVDTKNVGSSLATSLRNNRTDEVFDRNPFATNFYNHDGTYEIGSFYIMAQGANTVPTQLNTHIPVKLQTTNVSKKSAEEAVETINKLVETLHSLSFESSQDVLLNEEVLALKDELQDYFNVTKSDSTAKDYFKIYNDTIKFNFTTDKGEFSAVIYLKNKAKQDVANLVVTDSSGNKLTFKNKEGEEVAALNGLTNPDQFKNALVKAFQGKRHNVNIRRMEKKEPYKGYDSYGNYLIQEGILQTDISVLKDTEGKVLKDSFGNPLPNVGGKYAKDRNSNLIISVNGNLQVEGVKKEVKQEKVETSEETEKVETSPVKISSFENTDIVDSLITNRTIIVPDKQTANKLQISKDVNKRLINDEIVTITPLADGTYEVKIENDNSGISRTKAVQAGHKTDNKFNVENAQQWWKSVFGENVPLDTNIAGIIVRNGVQAWGIFEDAMVRISQQAIAGTEYHEAFHVVFHLYLNDEQRQEILEEAKTKYGNIGAVMLEEALADEFMDYKLKKGQTSKVSEKAKGFFAKLWNWIKSWFSKRKSDSSVQKLFDKIDSGTFNYKPDERMIEYAKGIKRTKLIEGFTRQEEAETISLLAKKLVDWYDNNANVTLKDVKANPELLAKTAIQRSLIRDLREVEEDKAVNIQRVLESFDDFYKKTKEFVARQFGIEQDDNINDNMINEIGTKWDDTAIFATSTKDSVSNYIKKAIMTTPKYPSDAEVEDGVLVSNPDNNNFLGLETFLDFNKVYPYIQRNMVGAVTLEEMLSRLENMANHDKSMYHLLDRLNNDNNLKSAWFANFRKQSPTKQVVLIKPDSVEVDDSNKNTSHYLLANEWKDSFLTKIENGYFTEQVMNDFIRQLNTEYKSLIYNDKFGDNFTQIVALTENVLNKLGIAITQEQITKTVNNEVNVNYYGSGKLVFENVFMQGITATLNEVVKFNKLKSDNAKLEEDKRIEPKFEFNSVGRFNTIAQFVNLFQYDRIESSFFDVKGNNVYSSLNPHHLSLFFDKVDAVLNPQYINATEAKEELLNILEQFASNPVMEYSNWLNQILPLEKENRTINDINYDFLKRWKYSMLDGVKDTMERDGQQYSDMPDNMFLVTQLLMYLETPDANMVRIPVLISSDSGNIAFISSQRYGGVGQIVNSKIPKTIKDKPNPIYQAVENTVMQEITRMVEARNLMFNMDKDGNLVPKEHKYLNAPDFDSTKHCDYTKLQKNYHYQKLDKNGMPIIIKDGKPQGLVFKFYNIPEVSKISSIFHNGVIIYDKLNAAQKAEFTKQLDVIINNFFNERLKKGIEIYGDTTINGKVVKQGSASILKRSKNFSRYNNFNDFILEFMINHYISNVEQFNFFVGEHAEYKSGKDTNKRAKEIVAPGVPLSQIYSGYSYKSATLGDIELESEIYESIVNSVSNALRKEKPLYKDLEVRIDKLRQDDITDDMNELERATHNLVSGYLASNIADAQGYITMDRYEEILRDLGRWNPSYESLFKKVRKGETLGVNDLTVLLQPIKGFYYGRDYDVNQKRHISNQVKYSTVPLIPQLVKGTEMEKLFKWINKNGLKEVYFDSAEKVGIRHIIKLADSNGKINEEALNKYSTENGFEFNTSYNHNWRLQLDVPDHLMDSENLLGTQIAKLLISNLSKNTTYTIPYTSEQLSASELIENYFDVMKANIEEDAKNLLNRIGAVQENGKWVVKDKTKIAEVLKSEVQRRGISDNYAEAVKLVEQPDGTYDFNLPLFVSSRASKWESILTSLFTNNVTDQKISGASAVMLSSAFITNKLESGDKPTLIDLDQYDRETYSAIQWHKDVIDRGDYTLKMVEDTESGVTVAEGILPAWSKKFYKLNEQGEYVLDDINNIPEELRTMVWYRIPSEAKYSTIVVKVVGFLPQALGSTLILPKEVVTAKGLDFDADKEFGMIRQFKVVTDENGGRTYVKYEYKQGEENSREARDNRIIDIYQSILTNKDHYREVISPQSFEDGKNVIAEIRKILGENVDNINPMQVEGQLYFRKQNIAGRALKGMAADSNAFLSVAQVAKMYLRKDLGYKVKYKIKDADSSKTEETNKERSESTRIKIYDVNSLISKYGSDNVTVEGDYATVNHTQLGWNKDDTFTNADDNITTTHASQLLAMILDIVKEGIPSNVNTYTFYPYIGFLNTGASVRYASLFIKQPILEELSEKVFENEGLFAENVGKEIEYVKRKYQTELFKLKAKNGDYGNMNNINNYSPKSLQIAKDLLDRIKAGEFVDVSVKNTKEVLGYKPTMDYAFDVEELRRLLEYSKTFKDLQNSSERYSDKESIKRQILYVQKQLQLVEMFKKYKDAGEAYQDIMRAMNADKIGAGPSMYVTDNMNRNIDHATTYSKNKFDKDGNFVEVQEGARVLVNHTEVGEIPATQAVFPKYFDLNHKSVYSILETYKENSNDLSVEVLSPFFIQQTPAFRNFVNFLTRELNLNYTEDLENSAVNFAKNYLLKDFLSLQDSDLRRILGVGLNWATSVNSLESFKELSVTNKLRLIKERYKSELTNDTHILNYLTPKASKNDVERNGIQTIEFINTKTDNMTDDRLVDSFIEMWNSSDEYVKDLAQDLVAYSYISSGFGMKKNSFSKLIPTEVFVELGLKEYLDTKMSEALGNPDLFTNDEILETFVKSNSNNKSVVPLVKTKWKDYDNKQTVDDTPIWEENAMGFITVSVEDLKNESFSVRKSPYISVPKTKRVVGENGKITFINDGSKLYKAISTDKTVYYVPVDKLGNFNFIEFGNKSIIETNQVPYTVEEYENYLRRGVPLRANDVNVQGFSYNSITSENPKARNRKDRLMFTNATQFIGGTVISVSGSSTNKFAGSFKEKANSGKYSADDMVMISVQGKRGNVTYQSLLPKLIQNGVLQGVYKNIYEVFKAEGTVMIASDKDSQGNVLPDYNNEYNIGDNIVRSHLDSFVTQGRLQKVIRNGIAYYSKVGSKMNLIGLDITNYELNELKDQEGYNPDGHC